MVGDVLYAVSEDQGWYYGLQGDYTYCQTDKGVPSGSVAIGGGSSGSKAIVSSVSFAAGQI